MKFNFFGYSFSSSFFKITNTHINQRLDVFLKQNFELPYPAIQRLLRTKKINVMTKTGKNSKPDYRLQISDEIKYPITLKPKEKNEIFNENSENEEKNEYNEEKAKIIKGMLIYEDENFIILNKISNISSQGGQNSETNLLPLLRNYYHYNSNIWIIHRLDKNTTGLLLLAKKKLAAQIMSKFLSEQENMEKYYLVFVDGVPDSFKKKGAKNGIIDLPMVFQNKKMKICNLNNSEGEKCVTFYQILGFFEISDDKIIPSDGREKATTVTLMKIRIKGGKKHQIRAHLSQVLGTPVIFDRKYGFTNGSLEKILRKYNEGFNENGKFYEKNKNTIVFNDMEKLFDCDLNAKKMVDIVQNENFKGREYFALHAFQIFLKTDQKVKNFKEFLALGEGKMDGEIMLKAKLPSFFLGFIENCLGEKTNEFLDYIDRIRF